MELPATKGARPSYIFRARLTLIFKVKVTEPPLRSVEFRA